MAGKGYNAGRVYLQVVPSYNRFMQTLRKDTNGVLGKPMADEAERRGADVGRAYTGGMQKELKKNPAKTDDITRGLKNHNKELVNNAHSSRMSERAAKRLSAQRQKSLVSQRMTRSLQRDLNKAMDKGGVHVRGYNQRIRELQGSIKQSGRATKEHVAQTRRLSHEMIAESQRTKNLARSHGLLSGARALDSKGTRSFQRDLRRVGRETNRNIAASKGLGRAHRAGGRSAISAKRGLGGLRETLLGIRGDTNDGANAFRFFNGSLLMMLAIGPALIPILGAIGGGLALMGSMALGAASGLGVAGLAMSGIGGALKAMGAAQKDANRGARDTGKAQRTAGKAAKRSARDQVMSARSIADAQRSLKDAYRSSSDSIEKAIESQRRSEQNLLKVQKEAKKAQQELTRARKEAKQELIDLDDQIKQNKLDERQGVIDLFNAHNTYGAAMSDGGATNLEKEQADIGLSQAQLNLAGVRKEQKKLGQEKKHADKTGIDGTKGVKRAEENLTRALERQKDAKRDLADEEKDTARTRVDAARTIADAQRSLSRAQEDAAYRVEDAAEAASAAGERTDRIANNLAYALKNLGPAGRRFAEFIFSLREGLLRLRNIAQEGFLPGLQKGMELIIDKYGPGFTDWVRKTAILLGELSEKAAEGLAGPQWQAFFKRFSSSSQTFIEEFARTFGGFGTGLATYFEIAIPYAEKFAKAIGDAGQRFANWADSSDGRTSITNFFDYIDRVGPKVGKFMSAFVGFIRDMGTALSPIGESVLENLTNLFNFLGKQDPKILTLLAAGILSIITALQLSAGFVAFVSMLEIVVGAPWLLVIAGLVGLGTAFYYLGKSGGEAGDTFRRFIDSLSPVLDILKDVWHMIKEQLVKTFNESLLPAVKSISDAFEKELMPSLERFWPVLKPLVKFLTFVFGTVLRGLIDGVKNLVLGVIKIISGVMDVITGIFTGDFGMVLDGLKKIFLGTIQAIWGYFNVMLFGRILGVFKLFGKALFGFLKRVFSKDILGMLKSFGSAMLKFFRHPINAVKAMFKFFVAAIQLYFEALFKAAGLIFKGLLFLFTGLWQGGKKMAGKIGDAFKWLGGKIADFGKGVWNVLKKVGGYFKNILTKPINGLRDFVETFITRLLRGLGKMKDKIGGILKSVGGFFGKKLGNPIITLVERVINGGIIGGINKIAGFVGLKGKNDEGVIPKIGPFKRFNKGGVAGVVPGYTPGRDNHTIAVGGGEAIMRPEVTKGLGRSMIDGLNSAAVRGGIGAVKKMVGYARGGVTGGGAGAGAGSSGRRVWPVPGPRHQHMSGYPWARWAGDMPVPMGTPVRAYANGIVSMVKRLTTSYGKHIRINHGNMRTLYAHLSKIGVRPGQPVKAGQIIGRSGSTGNSTGPHTHFEIAGGSDPIGAGSIGGGGGPVSKLAALGKGALSALRNPKKFFSDRVAKVFSKLGGGVSGKLLDMAKHIPKRLIGDMVKWVKKKAFGLLGVGKDFFVGAGKKVGNFAKGMLGFGFGGKGDKGTGPRTKVYDTGGRIPPGVTTVLNKSNKPEALLTDAQWKGVLAGRSGGGDTYYMEAHGSDATAATRQLAADLQRARRRVRNSGTLTRKVN